MFSNTGDFMFSNTGDSEVDRIITFRNIALANCHPEMVGVVMRESRRELIELYANRYMALQNTKESAPQPTTHKGMSFLRSLWNKFVGKNASRL